MVEGGCQYCGEHCFRPVPKVGPVAEAYRRRGVTAMATCETGQFVERQLLGYSYDDILAEDQMKSTKWERDDVLDRVLEAAPLVEGQKWAVVGIRCLWWTTFPEDVDKSGISGGRCPFCGGPVEEVLLTEFVTAARLRAKNKSYERHGDLPPGYGPGGLETLMKAHHRSAKTCRRHWDRVGVKVRGS